ncbi:KpsF/GutQ family sugar-phosphate isomerase [Neptuniibacter sp.]|uniref:KpsF/GutQ family sugar-phosphate isomerase n=1 Tax=Neptuniibacter sp. TaxID=1962643 RepID=UPI00261EA06C|nr:KpsF/GutQ family sugar-phosphate isomerase [Neptuniibacter sp.]MCP4598597.1 KpsF/GutQ family sugar-phosphate isomerase [Neptuniibacter sp.]
MSQQVTQPAAKPDFLQSAKRTITLEAEAVSDLLQHLDQNFNKACELMLNCSGRVIVTGMGKSGHIGKKIAATLASTGTPSFFVHPGEASHGDLGMFTENDVVIALSNSGETAEVVTIIPLLKRMKAPLISITANPNSNLSKAADANLHIGVEREACPLDLAPTSSTTTQLVLGDALAIALLEARGFSAEDFAFSHPGGSLGRRLLLKVSDVMHTGSDIPCVTAATSLRESLLEVTQKRLGMTAVVNDNNELQGIFTDGDLRRALDQNTDLQNTPINQVMTQNCTTVTRDMLAAECLQIMESKKINALIVTDEGNKPVGALNMHDLLKAGVI